MRLTLYSKPGCHLCDDAKNKIARLVARGFDLSVEERDISADPALFERFRYTIPVVELPDGRTHEAPISEYKLEQVLRGRRAAVPLPPRWERLGEGTNGPGAA